MNLKRYALFLLLTAFCLPALAQRDTVSLNTIVTKTSKQIATYPFEKVYLHLDKPYYAAGDTIWFKAYVTMDNHLPTQISNVVYVDIANGQDSISRLLKLPIVNGVASGSLPLLPADFRQGNYHLRAYTAYMRNYEPEYFFNKNVVIGNAVQNEVATNASFKSTVNGGATKVNAAITYKEQSNTLLSNKKVTWTVVSNGEEISKGKGTTDANGILTAEFTGSAGPIKNGTLVTVIDMGNRKAVTSSFPLKNFVGGNDIQFFPEGGELITGVRSKVAFKAINNNGTGTDVKGDVTDNTGTVVATITSAHLGMGFFAFTPEEGKTYKANVTYTDGNKGSYDMPRIRTSGINLSAYNNDPENLTIKISANSTYFQANQGKVYYIIAQSGGAVFFAAQTSLTSAIYSAAIPKSKFPTGLVQLTLLTDHGVALSERVVFMQHNDALNLSLTSAAKSYTTRQKVRLAVSAKNKTLPVAGNFSISVIDETKVPFDESSETTILTSLLLTSDLKGYIEKPNYYFGKDAAAADNLDILMLTQGYRRISYRNIIAGKAPNITILPEQNGLEVSGVLRNSTGMTISKGYVKLQVPSKNFFAESVTDMVGNFRFSKLNFADSSKVIITGRASNTPSRNLVVTANDETYQYPSKNNMTGDEVVNIDSTFKDYLQNSKRRYDNLHILKEVVIKSTVIKPASHSNFPALTGLPALADQTVDGSRLKGCNNLMTCLPSMLLGVTVDNNIIYLARNYNSDKKPMQVFLNGMPVDFTSLSTVSVAEVDNIEVFKNTGVSGIDAQYGTAGLVEITLKKKEKGTKVSFAQLQELIPPPNILTIMPLGYAINREFYSPKYDVIKTGNLGGDLRTTIYWNPKVVTDKTTGATFVEFYNADGRGTYKATIEGMDADGNLGRYVYRYTVK
ncbi:carboxypeptidase regulatory-like domain-containing protein [Mucilaginibacter terrenus]|uniref:Carboxypeptidase regulatory-like domain-containing protein n=1 Tax=Mucilaginibacter terrenus TaxID=2482727 RepID=A0A3E2NWZ0_9SPHI|nr:carboxypeptidase regulatory-like domain-containing protein [Mucilaginibacter terrenus]RFZ85441.1 carboxypeptidase regulatory-like domain-containing protein [Mucilaginibacter terrenus]